MLGNSLKSVATRETRLKLVFNEFKYCKQSVNVRLYYKTSNLPTYKQSFINRSNSSLKFSFFRFSSDQAAIKAKNNNSLQIRSGLQKLMHERMTQAYRSVLFEIRKKEDLPYALAYCEKFGIIKAAFSYSGETKKNFTEWTQEGEEELAEEHMQEMKDKNEKLLRHHANYLLLEFSNETTVEALLKKCECKKDHWTIPVHSRILQYEKITTSCGLSEVKINEETNKKSLIKPEDSVSEVIEDIYLTEKLTELDIRLRYFFCTLIKESVSSLFPLCEVVPFGSSINGIGKQGCDLDLMLKLNSQQVNGNSELHFVNKTYFGEYDGFRNRIIVCLAHVFQTLLPGISIDREVFSFGETFMQMAHKILNLECDFFVEKISFLHMTDIIYFFGEIDDRIQPLMYGVKKWAEEAKVIYSSSSESGISKRGLTTLLIFFLQNRPAPILPPLNDAVAIIDDDDDSFYFGVKYFKSVEEWKRCASLNKESLGVLLKEFLSFLATEPFKEYIICLMSGKKRRRIPLYIRSDISLWIISPFDEFLNVTDNVSYMEFTTIREKAKISAKCLENYLNQRDDHITDFCALLDIPTVSSMNLNTKEDY